MATRHGSGDDMEGYDQVRFERNPLGRVVCILMVTLECQRVITTTKVTPSGDTMTLWAESWNEQWWGRQLDQDAAGAQQVRGGGTYDDDLRRADANNQAALDRAAAVDHALADRAGDTPMPDAARGVEPAAVRPPQFQRHWSSMFTQSGGYYYAPFNHELQMLVGTVVVDPAEFRAKKRGLATHGAQRDAAVTQIEEGIAAAATPTGQGLTGAADQAAQTAEQLRQQRAAQEDQAAREAAARAAEAAAAGGACLTPGTGGAPTPGAAPAQPASNPAPPV